MTFNDFKQTRIWKEFIGLLGAFCLAMAIRTFLFQPYIIPSESMVPTLLVGDFLFASKFPYGYTKATFPLHMMPLNHPFKMSTQEPQVGDVVLFNNPKDLDFTFFGKQYGKDYIKRLIGKPGDKIQMKHGLLYINGTPTKLEADGEYHLNRNGKTYVAKKFIETLPNGIKHPILKFKQFGEAHLDNTEEFTVPEGHYFLMGDNRDNSLDCRSMEHVGFVSANHLIGKALIRWLSIEDARWWEIWNYPFTIRFSRIMTSID
jgi:signal peptidase I